MSSLLYAIFFELECYQRSHKKNITKIFEIRNEGYAKVFLSLEIHLSSNLVDNLLLVAHGDWPASVARNSLRFFDLCVVRSLDHFECFKFRSEK